MGYLFVSVSFLFVSVPFLFVTVFFWFVNNNITLSVRDKGKLGYDSL